MPKNTALATGSHDSVPSSAGNASLSRRKTVGWCFLASAVCLILLGAVMRLDKADLRIPLNYLGDAIVFIAKTKGIIQGDWLYHNSRIGMPFGADLRDFPLNITLDSAFLWLGSLFTAESGLLLNLYFLAALAATAALAAYCLLRLNIYPPVAVAVAVVYALQPYGFYRGISHLHSLFYLVPLVATGAIEIALGRMSQPKLNKPRLLLPSIPAYLWLTALAVGFSYQYTAFFACFVLLSAAVLAFAGGFRRESMMAILLIAVICVGAVVDLSPSLVHWLRNGTNPAMLFKYPAEAEIYGLKIRFLLTPTPEHPVPLFRAVSERFRAAGFPFDNENESARLGTIGSIGFLMLLGVLLLRCVKMKHEWTQRERILAASAALCMACVLLATVGGFGDFFNTFVLPDIRCYNRIAPYIAFFSLIPVALALDALGGRWIRGKRSAVIFALGLGFTAILAAYDQAVTSGWRHELREPLFKADRDFVREVETVLPADSMVFQLPYTDFPVEHLVEKMFNNDQGRPYVHSTKYKWTWGAVTGTTSSEWNRKAAALPIPELLHSLCHRGFSAVWVDLNGYNAQNSPEAALTRETKVMPMRSANGRYLFYDLRPYCTERTAAEAGLTQPELRSSHPVELTLERGFFSPRSESPALIYSRLRRGTVVMINPLDEPRDVTFSVQLHNPSNEAHTITIEVAGERKEARVERLQVYSHALRIPPRGQVPLKFTCDGKATVVDGIPGRVYFAISGLAVADR